MYVSRKNGARGLIGCENSVKSGENGLECYVKNNLEPLLAAVRTTITNEETVDPKELRKTKEEQKNEWTAKKSMDNSIEIGRTRIQTTHGDG